MNLLIALATLAALLGLGVVLFRLWPGSARPARPRRPKTFAYRRKSLLTGNEKHLFRLLRYAVPELYVCPQVSLGALLEPAANKNDDSVSGRANFWAQWSRVKAKRADFCLLSRESLEVLLIVELDDRSHDGRGAQDAERDGYCAQGGYRTLRIRRIEGKLPGAAALRDILREYLPAQALPVPLKGAHGQASPAAPVPGPDKP